MKKIIISDYDETLYTDEKSMLINIDMINQFRNKKNLFVIATGRNFDSLKQEIMKYNIRFDYLILNHGAVTLDSKLKVIGNSNINNNIVGSILKDKIVLKKYIKSIKLFDIFNEDIESMSYFVTKVEIILADHKYIKKVISYINNKYIGIRFYVVEEDNYSAIEIVSANTNKCSAIKKILIKEKINSENVYTIGNGYNDLEMIEEYNGYGMKNSEQRIKKAASKLYDNVSDLIKKEFELDNS